MSTTTAERHGSRSAAMIPAAMTPVAPTIDDVFLGGIRRAATCVRDWVKMQQQQTLASGCLSCSNGMGVPAEGSCSSSSQSSGLEFCEVQLLPSQPMYYTGDASGTNNSPCKTSTPPTSSPQHKLRSAVIAAAKLAAPCILCSATADTAATTASATATAAKVHDTKMSLWSNDTTASNSIATTPQQPSSPAGSVGSHSGNATSVTPTSSGGESSAGDANTDTVNTNLTTINASTNTTSHTDASTHMIATASSIPDTCINSMPPAAGSGAAPLPGKPRPLNLSQLLASRLECSSPAHSHGSPTCTPSPGRGSVGSEVSLSCLYEDQSMHLLPSAGASQLAGMLRSRSSPACTPPAAQRSGPRVLPKPVPWEGRGCGRPQVLIVLGPADEQDEDKPRGMLQQEVHVQGEAQVATAVPSVAASEAITTGPASVRLSTPQLLASQQAQAGQAVPHSKQPVPAVWDGNVGPVGPNTDSSHQHASAPGHAVYEPALPSLSVAAMAAQDELPADQPPGTQPKTLAELCELLASLEPHTAPESGPRSRTSLDRSSGSSCASALPAAATRFPSGSGSMPESKEHVIDLGGGVLEGPLPTPGSLRITVPHVTLTNGTLMLPDGAGVAVAAHHVTFACVTVSGAGGQVGSGAGSSASSGGRCGRALVRVEPGASVRLVGCTMQRQPMQLLSPAGVSVAHGQNPRQGAMLQGIHNVAGAAAKPGAAAAPPVCTGVLVAGVGASAVLEHCTIAVAPAPPAISPANQAGTPSTSPNSKNGPHFESPRSPSKAASARQMGSSAGAKPPRKQAGSGWTGHGVLVVGAGAQISLDCCRISGSSGNGASAVGGGTLRARCCVAAGNVGAGFCAAGTGSVVHMHVCVAKGNGGEGADGVSTLGGGRVVCE